MGAAQTYHLRTEKTVYEVLDWSPDGCYAVYLPSSQLGEPLGPVRALHIVSWEERELIHSWDGSMTLRWSPDGEWIA